LFLFLFFSVWVAFSGSGPLGGVDGDGRAGKSTGTDRQRSSPCTSGRVRPLSPPPGGTIGAYAAGIAVAARVVACLCSCGLASVYRLFGRRVGRGVAQAVPVCALLGSTGPGLDHGRRGVGSYLGTSLGGGGRRGGLSLFGYGGHWSCGGEGWAGRDCMTHGFGWLGGYSTGQGPVGSGGFHVFLFDWRLVLRVCVQSSTVGGRQAVHARGRLLFLFLCLCVCRRKRDASRDLT
jgi:hypothetical protein